jgi:upstream activation factor subunit UAF30
MYNMPRTKNPPTADKSSKKPVAKKTTTAKSETVSVAPVVDTVTPVSTTAATTATTTATAATDAASNILPMTEDFTDFMAKLQQVNSLLSSLRTDFRALEKKATRELKAANKANQKRKRKQGNRSPSGFVKPTLISNELAAFLGKDKGSEMARTEVTREINAYIRKHQLQDKTNGRKIIPDNSLTKLLKLNKTDELTYFNLQKYMSPHFAKANQEPKA